VPRPDLARARFPAVLLVLLASFVPAAQAQSGDGDASRSLKQTERALERERRRAREAGQALEQVQAELGRLRAQAIEAAQRLQNEETTLADVEQRLADLARQEQRKREALRREDRELGSALANLSRLARRSPTALMANAGAPLDTYRSVRLVAALSQGLRSSTQTLEAELAELGGLRRRIAAEEQRHRRQAAEMAAQRTVLARLVDEKAGLEARLADENRAAARSAERLAGKAGDLRELVAKLAEAEEQRRREAAERAEAERQAELARLAEQVRQNAERERLAALAPPLPEHKPVPAAAPVVAATPSASFGLFSGEPFSEARGKLPMPARGRVVETFGQRNGEGQAARGISIETVAGAQVVAPFDGQLVYVGEFRRYGPLLIISLGEGYHILLSGMARLYGVVGQQVLAGEPVGEMGEVGAGQPRLYVELRRKGEPINPLPWLSAAKGKISG